MLDFSFFKAVIMFAVTFFVTFVGASTGGSAMFTIPLCIFLGFPVHVAVATTRFSAFFSMVGAFFGFSKHKKIDYRMGVIGSLIACIGAYFGSNMLLLISEELAKKVMGFLMLLLLIVSFLKKSCSKSNQREKTALSGWKKCLGYFMFFVTGGIGGAFGGQGVLLVYTLTLFFGMNFIVAAGTRVIISFFITTISLMIYSNAGAVHWHYGIILAVASLFGTYLGAIYSIKKGEGLVEKIFEAIVVMISLKLLCFS
ncbi:MAG: sulfite exporter TauE/SafE family protein [Alphaproteobacteria bacterium]|nr:sulfite exporter TauE/SafE family protein [Alphaproteobacteria bacterium]